VGKVRVFELAKELGTTSRKLIEVMEGMNITVRNHMSTLEDDEAQKVVAILTGQAKSEAAPAPKPEEPPPGGEAQAKKPAARPTRKKDKARTQDKAAPGRKARKAMLEEKQAAAAKRQRRQVRLEGRVTIGELAAHFAVTPAQLLTQLLELGVVSNINQSLPPETIELLADEYNVEIIHVADPVEQELLTEETAGDKRISRVPVVTVLGHVDHGKTSLLDSIRHANVTAGEVGGITQHIGAYQVEVNNQKVVFLDTPGHEAFTAMRARGAQVTDIAVLVVAADDGVMPQTVEAINHARAAEVPIIVALNKIDKANANPDRVKQQLSEQGLVPEEWGGDTICVNVSALKAEGLEDLLEMILLVAEVSELNANPERPARGTVIEAQLDRGRGPVATVLIQDGTLYIGAAVVCGTISGKVRAMINEKGERVATAGPSTPVAVLGLNEVPMAGDRFQVASDDRVARQVAAKRSQKIREATRNAQRITLDNLFKQIQDREVKELNLIIKGDVHGSVEALQEALLKLSLDEVKIRVIHTGVGSINESDVMLASASNAIVIGFNVRPDANARKLAEQDRVDLRLYRIIYEILDDIKAAVTGMLKPVYKEVIMGQAGVRQVFKVSRLGSIAGSHVNEGKIPRNAMIRVIRDGVVVHEGRIASLKRFKDDVREVANGFECGILLENYNDLQDGDVIEAYQMEQVTK
jgi:translation initiation factor IF-2